MLFIHTLKIFDTHSDIRMIVLVVSPDDEDFVLEILQGYKWNKQIRVVAGGETRQESVYSGLQTLAEGSVYVAIHDGARPFLPQGVLSAAIAKVKLNGAVTVAVPVKDTIAVIADEKVSDLPARDTLWSIQTPQIFRTNWILEAHENALADSFMATDDATLVRRQGHEVFIQIGGYTNIKITTPEDIWIGEMILQERKKRGEWI